MSLFGKIALALAITGGSVFGYQSLSANGNAAGCCCGTSCACATCDDCDCQSGADCTCENCECATACECSEGCPVEANSVDAEPVDAA